MQKKLLTTMLALVCAICCLFSFVACDSEDKPEPEPETVLTDNTDFSALEGEQVTEDEWKAAFAKSVYSNVSLKVVTRYDKRYDGIVIEQSEEIYYWKKVGDYYIGIYNDENDFDNGIFPKDDKLVNVILGGPSGKSDGYVGQEFEKEIVNSDFDFGINWGNNYTAVCPDFSEFFSLFEYDETIKAYTFDHKEVKINSISASGDIYNFATVKIVNGKLAFVNAGRYGGKGDMEYKYEDSDIYFYDFGTTVVTIPEYTLVDVN